MMRDPETTPPAEEQPKMERKTDRRGFLALLSGGMGAIAATIVAIPVIGFLLTPVLEKQEKDWRDVGRVDDFQIDQTVEVSFEDASSKPWAGATARTAAWLRRLGPAEFIAFSINCTHLGCPVRWESGPQLFMCPCHGGVYYGDGEVAGGPPPKSLPRYPVRVRNGKVQIQTSAIPIT